MKKNLALMLALCVLSSSAGAQIYDLQNAYPVERSFAAIGEQKEIFRSGPAKEASNCIIEFDEKSMNFIGDCDLYSQPGAIKAKNVGGLLIIKRK